jgi:hypothetical protein
MTAQSFSLAGELEAKLIARRGSGRTEEITVLSDADGVMFLCPKCYAANGGPVRTHVVICWFAGRGVPEDETPGPGRWRPSGTGLADLTFVGPGAASVALQGGCFWHGFIRQGRATA